MKKVTVLGVAFAALLAGCSNTPTMSYEEKNIAYADYIVSNKLQSLKKINTFRLHGWQSLTNDYLILSTSPKKKFLIEVNGYCPDLGFAQAIKINQGMSSMLTTRFDSISVIGSDVGSHHIKCHIKTIHKIDKAQAKEISAIGKPVDDSKETTEEPQKS